jgi:hypothetical protein
VPFQEFFRKHFENWVDGFDYREAGPQLLLQAFLQRIVNSGGRVEREYGLGLQRTDLLVIWPFKSGCREVVLEPPSHGQKTLCCTSFPTSRKKQAIHLGQTKQPISPILLPTWR